MNYRAMNADGRLRFTRGVEVLASVDHPTLLTLREFIPLDGADSPAIMMGFMSHGSYDRLIEEEKNGRRPPDWDATSRFIVIYGISVGMKVLHSQRIIHRDLKPADILLDDSFEPRVADFGLAKSVEQGQSQNQTMFGGTVHFMAPEISMGESYDWSADVYAFAVLVYVAVTGEKIFPGLTDFQCVTKIVAGERPPFPPGFDGRWKSLIEECWCHDAKSRPTFDAIVQRLGSAEFVNDSINVNCCRAYQSRVLQ
jgi:serine/threonine protein kinase